MKCLYIFVVLTLFLTFIHAEEPKKEKTAQARQMEYISLINTLLQQTNVLTTVDGALLAITTMLASLVTRFKPFLIATALSYLIYVATAILIPAPLAKMGLPTMDVQNKKMMGRSVDGGESSSKLFDGLMAETLLRSIKISPVKTIVTNVSVNVITDTMGRIRMFSRMLVQQLSLFQRNMVWFSRSLSNECVSRFLCRVGQFTETNFPTASSLLRTLADNYPGMDDYAIAVVRGTSSSNCSLIYPDCTM
ncbi:uncharacterized protein [Parasteatoda tepidariorum]|uniref:uncharacterized protein n=1 Tax=Parasteatoda tepidariorum TaxID=114398 RepID=UPI00077F8BA4|nr:uncharacterized protein LOC107445378 [Parasteatoda tepidariorum]